MIYNIFGQMLDYAAISCYTGHNKRLQGVTVMAQNDKVQLFEDKRIRTVWGD